VKILYLDTPLDPPGGGQLSLLSMAAEIAKKHGVKVFIHDNLPFGTRLKEAGLESEVVPLRNIYSALKRERPDLVHCNSGTTKYSFFSALVCRMLGIPFLWHVRVSEKAPLKDDMIAFFSSKIIVVSETVKNRFRSFWHKKIVKIHNAVPADFPVAAEAPAGIRRRLGISENEKVAGVFSRLERSKGQAVFLEAAGLLAAKGRSLRLIIAGEGEEKDNLKRISEKLGISGKVIFTGYLPDPAGHIGACDIVVNPSVEPEGFGRVVIEAMSLGKPVVSSNLGGPLEIIEDGKDGILCEPSPEGFSAALERLLKDDALCSAISANARKKAPEKFSLAGQIEKVGNLYAEFAKR